MYLENDVPSHQVSRAYNYSKLNMALLSGCLCGIFGCYCYLQLSLIIRKGKTNAGSSQPKCPYRSREMLKGVKEPFPILLKVSLCAKPQRKLPEDFLPPFIRSLNEN